MDLNWTRGSTSPERADSEIGSTRTFVGSDNVDTDGGSSSSNAPHPAAQQIGRFQVRRNLGQGAFGSVYLAYDPTLDREVALKVPREAGSWTDQKRQGFLHEARVAARLKHPHVVTIYDAGDCTETGVFIAMEFVEGEPLSKRLGRGKLNASDAVRICSQIASAIHEGHKLGLVHRDLKPSNILLDAHGDAKVCDFGLTLHEDEQLERRRQVSGTLPYMSPEQLEGDTHHLDGRSDIWSLGVVLYECLAGRRPFRGDSPADIRDDILTRNPKPLRQIDDSIPESIDCLCQQCLERDLSRRVRTALDFRQALLAPTPPPKRSNTRVALTLSLAGLALLASAAIARRYYQPVEAERLESAGQTGTVDLFDHAPLAVVFESADIHSQFSYMQSPRRFIVDSSHWSAFSCGTHDEDMSLDVVALHDSRPGGAGVFWGLHPEPAADGSTQQSCIAVVVEPSGTSGSNAIVRVYRLTVAKDEVGHIDFQVIDALVQYPVQVDWSAPMSLEVCVTAGKAVDLRVQRLPVALREATPTINWSKYAKGQCGLVSAGQRVIFTRALLQP